MRKEDFLETLREYNGYYKRDEISKEEYERFRYWLDRQADNVDWDDEDKYHDDY